MCLCFSLARAAAADVWLPQAEDVPEHRRLLHLQSQVVQLPLHRQQALRDGLQELLRVSLAAPSTGPTHSLTRAAVLRLW